MGTVVGGIALALMVLVLIIAAGSLLLVGAGAVAKIGQTLRARFGRPSA